MATRWPILTGFAIVGTFSTFMGLVAYPFIFPTINYQCWQDQHCLKYNDTQQTLTEIMNLLEENNYRGVIHKTKPDSLFNLTNVTTNLSWVPLEVHSDVRKINLIKKVLRKERRRLSYEYLNMAKKRLRFKRKHLYNDGNTNDSYGGLICENPSNLHFQSCCVYGNKSLDANGTDLFDMSLRMQMLKEVFGKGDPLCELGFVYETGANLRRQIPGILGYRCKQTSGVCLKMFGRESMELAMNQVDGNQMEISFRFKMHKQNVIFFSDEIIQSIYKIEPDGKDLLVYPACVVYNPHLAKISLSFSSNTDLQYDVLSIDNHIFVSSDNKTISNWPIEDVDKWLGTVKTANSLLIILSFAMLIADKPIFVIVMHVLLLWVFVIIVFHTYMYNYFRWYVSFGIAVIFIFLVCSSEPKDWEEFVRAVLLVALPCLIPSILFHYITA